MSVSISKDNIMRKKKSDRGHPPILVIDVALCSPKIRPGRVVSKAMRSLEQYLAPC